MVLQLDPKSNSIIPFWTQKTFFLCGVQPFFLNSGSTWLMTFIDFTFDLCDTNAEMGDIRIATPRNLTGSNNSHFLMETLVILRIHWHRRFSF